MPKNGFRTAGGRQRPTTQPSRGALFAQPIVIADRQRPGVGPGRRGRVGNDHLSIDRENAFLIKVFPIAECSFIVCPEQALVDIYDSGFFSIMSMVASATVTHMIPTVIYL